MCTAVLPRPPPRAPHRPPAYPGLPNGLGGGALWPPSASGLERQENNCGKYLHAQGAPADHPLARLILESGKTLYVVAAEVGINYSRLSDYANGRVQILAAHCTKLRDYFGADPVTGDPTSPSASDKTTLATAFWASLGPWRSQPGRRPDRRADDVQSGYGRLLDAVGHGRTLGALVDGHGRRGAGDPPAVGRDRRTVVAEVRGRVRRQPGGGRRRRWPRAAGEAAGGSRRSPGRVRDAGARREISAAACHAVSDTPGSP